MICISIMQPDSKSKKPVPIANMCISSEGHQISGTRLLSVSRLQGRCPRNGNMEQKVETSKMRPSYLGPLTATGVEEPMLES